MKEWAKQEEDEQNRVLHLKGQWRKLGNGYKERWGEDNWKIHLRKELHKMIVCVTDLMDHVVSESKRYYEDTLECDDFLIFHDGGVRTLKTTWNQSIVFVKCN